MLARADEIFAEVVDVGDELLVALTPAANDPHYPAYAYADDLASRSTLYEEFHPFGTTSYAANDASVEVSPKRYRYIGKERDEETGLYHCGARYYASWLARWTAADPIGLRGGLNRYAYCRGNPIGLRDPGGTDPIADSFQRLESAARNAAAHHANLQAQEQAVAIAESDGLGEEPQYADAAFFEGEAIDPEEEAARAASGSPGAGTTLLVGVGLLVSGVALLPVATGATGGAAVFWGLTSGLGIASGGAVTGTGLVQAGAEATGTITPAQSTEVTDAAVTTAMVTSSPGSVAGSVVGAAVTGGNRSGIEIGGTLGGLANLVGELGVAFRRAASPMAGKRIGHTFSKHGSANTEQLLREAAGSGRPVGQWLDDAAAEKFIADRLDKLKSGAQTFDLPPGMGRVVNPDGTLTPATKARLVPSKSGVKTAYPLN